MKIWFADYNKEYDLSELEGDFLYGNKINLVNQLELLYIDIRKDCQFLWNEPIEKCDNFYQNTDEFDDKQFPKSSWKKIGLKVWGFNFPKKLFIFKTISKIITENQDIISCQIARLAPCSQILPHCGETNAIYRVHLCLKTKYSEVLKDAAYFRLGNKSIIWEEGKSFGFVDALKHEAFNNTNTYRYVLIIDVLRPKYKNVKFFVSTRIITSQLYLMFLSKLRLIENKLLNSSFIISILHFVFFIPFFIVLFLNEEYTKYILKKKFNNDL